jgi:hypothetical protein
MNHSFNEIVCNWGFIVSGATLLALGFINGWVRLVGTNMQKMIWPKIAIILLMGFIFLLGGAYANSHSVSVSNFFGIFFFWTISPYYTGIALFVWTKREFWNQ